MNNPKIKPETEWPEVVIALGQEIQRLRQEIAELKRAAAVIRPSGGFGEMVVSCGTREVEQ